MAITDSQFQSWLKDSSAARCVLVEAQVKSSINGLVTTKYLSNRGYVTGPSDTPANTSYMARVTGGVKFTRSLSLDGQISLSFGDIELINTDGALDEWLDDYWVNRTIRIYVGDVSWSRADFRELFQGTLTGIDSRKRDRVNLKISDRLQTLNTVAYEVKLGGGVAARADDLRPLCFGECHNVTPLLVDHTINEYMVHDGPIESIIEVRDNGVPVPYTANLAAGKFTLISQPAGAITVSVQGAKITTLSGSSNTYSNKVADIIYYLMTSYGNPSIRPQNIDIDMAGMVQFNTDIPYAVGVYLPDRENVLDICNRLAASVGARLYVNTAGKIGLVRLTLPWGGATKPIGSNDMLDRSLEIKQVTDVVASAKVGYCRNWTVQASLTTGIVTEHAALYAEEWLTQTASDSTTASNYNLFTNPVMVETNLIRTDEAVAEANRRLNLFNVQRKVFKFTGFAHMQDYALGSYVVLTHPRFGLGAGKVGQIISVAIDLMKPQIDFEVLI